MKSFRARQEEMNETLDSQQKMILSLEAKVAKQT